MERKIDRVIDENFKQKQELEKMKKLITLARELIIIHFPQNDNETQKRHEFLKLTSDPVFVKAA